MNKEGREGWFVIWGWEGQEEKEMQHLPISLYLLGISTYVKPSFLPTLPFIAFMYSSSLSFSLCFVLCWHEELPPSYWQLQQAGILCFASTSSQEQDMGRRGQGPPPSVMCGWAGKP